MNKRIERIKEHLDENKTTYIACAVTAVGTSVIFFAASRTNVSVVTNMPIACWKPRNTQVVLNFTERSTQSKPVHLVGTERYFDSLSDAARKTGHSLSNISKVVNGQKSDIGGDVFELLQTA
jgi:hypothetical protein